MINFLNGKQLMQGVRNNDYLEELNCITNGRLGSTISAIPTKLKKKPKKKQGVAPLLVNNGISIIIEVLL